jgi:hypothetical protein
MGVTLPGGRLVDLAVEAGVAIAADDFALDLDALLFFPSAWVSPFWSFFDDVKPGACDDEV